MKDQDGAELCFPQLLNDSCKKPKISQSDAVLMYLLFFISVFTVTLNLLVIISVSHFRQLHTPTNLLILSLAVADLFVGLASMFEVYRQTGCWMIGDIMCCVYDYAATIIASVSVGIMVLISVDRYVAICDPLYYPTRITVTRVKMCVCMCWMCCVVYSGVLCRYNLTQPGEYNICYGQCVTIAGFTDVCADVVLSFIVPVTVIIILYMRVFVTAVSQARAMRSHVAAGAATLTTKKSELKAARTLGVVILVFLICFCPNYCFFFLHLTNDRTLLPTTGMFMLCINPCLNPVIYALFYPWFRKAIRLIFSLQILQPGSRETNML